MESVRAPSALPTAGELIDGKYRIDSLLGQGGMGAVFRATHAHTGRGVALKVIVPAFAADEAFLKRFEREARAAGSLRHPNIVDVTDFGYATTPRGRLAYLVMEFLDGCSLADVLRQQAGLPLAWSVDVLEQVGTAVEEAHRAGLLHRDLKPDNIWLEPNRKGGYTVKVLDFGLAKLTGGEAMPDPNSPPPVVARAHTHTVAVSDESTRVRTAETRADTPFDEDAPTTARPAPAPLSTALIPDTVENATAVGAIVGTPAYMSPEQCKGLPLTPASDVYSLGVIAYRMLAGKLPFAGNADEQMKAHVAQDPPPISKERPDLPPDASDLVMQALSKDPGARPKSAGAFAAMLSARVQPTTDFLRSALFIFIQHLRGFVEASIRWLSPALALAATFSLAGIAEAAGYKTFLPYVPLFFVILGPQLLAIAGIFGLQGALVPAVMQAIVAPLQPLDLRSLQKIFRGRLSSYIRGIVPMIGLMIVFFVWVLGIVLLIPTAVEPLRPFLRLLPRPVAMVLVMLVVMPLMIAPLVTFRRGLFGAGMQFLGPVAIMEGRFGKDAMERSKKLARASGRALRAVRIASLAIGAFFGLTLTTFGAAMPRGLPDWAPGAIQGPVTALGMAILAPFLSVVSALTYLRALKAAGESPDDVLLAFEQEILPPSHWKLAARERILTQIDATRG